MPMRPEQITEDGEWWLMIRPQYTDEEITEHCRVTYGWDDVELVRQKSQTFVRPVAKGPEHDR